MKRLESRRAFTLLELVIGFAFLIIAAAILLPSLGKARSTARMSVCLSNQRQLGIAMNSYAADFKDRFPVFSWSGSPDKPANFSQYADLNGATDRVAANTAEAIDLLRRRTGREDLAVPTSWHPYLRHSYMTLTDYLASRLPERIVACPEDKALIQWQDDIAGFDEGAFGDQQPKPDAAGKLAPYASSYQPTMSLFDHGSPAGSRLSQGERSSQLVVPGAEALRKMKPWQAKLSEVRWPSGKVYTHEEFARHDRTVVHFGSRAGKIAMSFVDSSAYVKDIATANNGWQPNAPDDPNPTAFKTDDFAWNPPTIASGGKRPSPPDDVIGKFRWTRGGLHGIDFGMGEAEANKGAGGIPK